MQRRFLPSLAATALAAVAVGAGAGPAAAQTAPDSTFFSTVSIEDTPSVHTPTDGDLWPTCWSDDDALYAANGDGFGFTPGAPSDIAVSRITGSPEDRTLGGETLVKGDQITAPAPAGFSRKPTGMLCVDGDLYLAVQHLGHDFNEAPSATIVKSTDKGRTWTRTSDALMTGHVFTTMWFLDYGKDGADNPTPGYVYAYGLDHNWRDSFTNVVPDPTDLYLARIPKASIQDPSTWQWSTGIGTWSSPGAVGARKPVLHDETRRYPDVRSSHVENMTTLSQGHVVYDKGLRRYLYSSWTEYTFELFEAPTPQGPWKRFSGRDFGGYPWNDGKRGGYGTIIPSKFISDDGTSMWMQSNVCDCGGGGVGKVDYKWSMRRVVLQPAVRTKPRNARDDERNLARTTPGLVHDYKVAHFGNAELLNDGVLARSEDDWNDENKGRTWWGYTWPQEYRMNRVVFWTGQQFWDGGWFAGAPRVEIRRDGVWREAEGQVVAPLYPGADAPAFTGYEIRFDQARGDGVRIAGTPGGPATFTSIAELEVFYGRTGEAEEELVRDPGFEAQASGALGAPWVAEGPDEHGVDRGTGLQRSGSNNAWIHPSDRTSTAYNGVAQTVAVRANKSYVLRAWVQTSDNVADGTVGVRDANGAVIASESFGAAGPYTPVTVRFRTGSKQREVTVFAGYRGPGSDAFARIDDVSLTRER